MPQYKLFILFLSLIFVSCRSSAQDVTIIKFADLEQRIENEDTEIQIINFWATWCKPCIEEMPILESIHDSSDTKVLLVSMDFASQQELVNQFVERKKLKPEVVLLDETDYDSWIPKIDSSWSGAIPATLIINHSTNKKAFWEGSLSTEKLLEKIEQTKK